MVIRLVSVVFVCLWFQSAQAFDHNHSVYNELLSEVVIPRGHQTDIDYALLKQQQTRLDNYLAELEAVTLEEYQSWDESQQLAFLINSYNAFTLKLIVMHYPEITSIRDLGGLIFSTPWDKKFFTLFGEKSTLDYIEHEVIRKDFAEPRIHFAVNCASRGCPPLQPEAYLAEKLDQQLEQATIKFIQDPERNRFIKEKNRLEISSIFNWYKPDFEKAAGTLEKYIAPYITDDSEIHILIVNRAASIKYLDYDWSLNVKK